MIQRSFSYKTIFRTINFVFIIIFLLVICSGCESSIVELNLKNDGTVQLCFVAGANKQTLNLINTEIKNSPHLVDNWSESLIDKAKKQQKDTLNNTSDEKNKVPFQSPIPHSQQSNSSNWLSWLNPFDQKNPQTPPPAPTPSLQPTQQAISSDNYKLLINTADNFIKKAREVAIKEGFKCDDFENDEIKGFKALSTPKSYDEIKLLGRASKGLDENSTTLFSKLANGINATKDADGKPMEITINIDLSNDLAQINNQLDQIQKLTNIKSDIINSYKAEFKVTTFKNPDSSNAATTTFDEKTKTYTLTWDLKKNKNINMKLVMAHPSSTSSAKKASSQTGTSAIAVIIVMLVILIFIILGIFLLIKKKKTNQSKDKSKFNNTLTGNKWNLK